MIAVPLIDYHDWLYDDYVDIAVKEGRVELYHGTTVPVHNTKLWYSMDRWIERTHSCTVKKIDNVVNLVFLDEADFMVFKLKWPR